MSVDNRESAAIDAENARDVDTAGLGPSAQWLQRAARAYSDSTDYYQSSLYDNWRANLANFRNEHEPGSKYHTDTYKHRSKIFRPKPRASERALSATAATALFTNNELIDLRGVDPNNAAQAEAAKLHKALLQHRLEVSIPWFLTCLGAYQDTNVIGICISKQQWNYRTASTYEPARNPDGSLVLDPETGAVMGYENKKVLEDKPVIDLLPPDNFRFDPNADWRDPVNSSPYLIELIPMYAVDVLAKMDAVDDKTGQPEWERHTIGEIIAAGRSDQLSQTVKDARQGKGRENPDDRNAQSEFTTVWVRFVIMRDETGQDMAAYTIGDTLMLTEPAPLEEYFPHKRELYRLGFSVIETHRTHPAGVIELNRPLSQALNDTANQRMDNVRLVLNKRWTIKRNKNVSLEALFRNAPGGGVMVDDHDDLKMIDTTDVTGSSYQEQDRLSVESDELLGTLGQASIMSNRALNETVGGMNLMSGAANSVQELGLRTFIETWVEPVLRTLVKLESLYETDEVILALAAGKAEVESQIDDALLQQDLVVRVNVGMGNTDPNQKMRRFLDPIKAVSTMPEFVAEVDWFEVGKEVFSLAGQGDGERFMLTEEKKRERAENAGNQQDPRIVVEQMRIEIKQLEMEQDAILRQMEMENDKEVRLAKIASDQNTTLEKLYATLGVQRETSQLKAALEQQRDKTARQLGALKMRYEAMRTTLQAQNLNQGYDTF